MYIINNHQKFQRSPMWWWYCKTVAGTTDKNRIPKRMNFLQFGLNTVFNAAIISGLVSTGKQRHWEANSFFLFSSNMFRSERTILRYNTYLLFKSSVLCCFQVQPTSFRFLPVSFSKNKFLKRERELSFLKCWVLKNWRFAWAVMSRKHRLLPLLFHLWLKSLGIRSSHYFKWKIV